MSQKVSVLPGAAVTIDNLGHRLQELNRNGGLHAVVAVAFHSDPKEGYTIFTTVGAAPELKSDAAALLIADRQRDIYWVEDDED